MPSLSGLVKSVAMFALTASAIPAPVSLSEGAAALETRGIGPKCIYDDRLPAFHYVIALDKNAPGVGTDCGLACKSVPASLADYKHTYIHRP
jgi:hypothetical protein